MIVRLLIVVWLLLTFVGLAIVYVGGGGRKVDDELDERDGESWWEAP